MFYNYLSKSAVLSKDAAMSKITPQMMAGIFCCRRAFDMETYGETAFIGGYHTSLRFPQEAVNREERQAQRMNYDYCVQTIAGLMKKYAPEILNGQEDGYGNG